MKRLPAPFLAALLLAATALAQNDLPSVAIALPTVAATPGEEVCLDIASTDFNGVIGLSFSLFFDPAALEFQRIDNLNLPNASLDLNFNLERTGEGQIAMLWFNLGSSDYPLPFTLFTLCFKVTGEAGSIVPIRFTNDPAPIEIIAEDGPVSEDFVQGLLGDGAVWIGPDELPDIPLISGTPALVSCDNAWKAGLDASVSGGAPPYRFQWSGPNGFTSEEEDLPAVDFGVYSLTVTDQNQSPAFAAFYLVKPQDLGAPPPLVAAADIVPATNCYEPDGAIALTFSRDAAGFSFQWSHGATTPNAAGLAPGSYAVSIVDERGCGGYWSGVVPNTNDFEIKVSARPAVCTQSKGRLEIASPLGEAYRYAWSDGANGLAIEDLAPGVYGLTVADVNTGCSKTAAPAVTAEGAIPLNIETLQPACDGAPGGITLRLPDGQPFAVDWNTGSQATQLVALSPGVYQTTITDLTAGCVRQERVVLRAPQLRVNALAECRLNEGAPDSVYVTISPLGGVPPFTFAWSTGDTAVSNGSNALGAALPAVLFATVTDGEGCVGHSAPPAPCPGEDQRQDLNATLYYECDGGLSFSAYVWEGGVPPYTFHWSTGLRETGEASGPTPVSGDGFVAVTITDAAGLTDILVGHPLPGGCQDGLESVALIAPDTVVEIDDRLAFPLWLKSTVDLEDLIFELHWDARYLQLTGLSGQGLALDAPIAEIALRGKTRLTFDLRSGRPADDRLAVLQFTPRAVAEEPIPVLLGYTKWTAAVDRAPFFITPSHGSVVILPDGGNVWPGDTDQSRAVDHRDLLPIGLAYNAAGVPRPGGTTDWRAQYAPLWRQTTPVGMVDYRHVDTNGDALINAADTAAIAFNWSKTTAGFHEPDHDRGPEPKANGAPLLVEGDAISSDRPTALPIVLGTTGQPAENVYGLAFSLSYAGAIADEQIYLDFSDSWLSAEGSRLLTIYRQFPAEKRVDVALVRTDGQPVSGYGTVARLILQGNNRTGAPQTATLDIDAVKMIDHQEQPLTAIPQPTSLTVDFSTATGEPAWARRIVLSPVPAGDELTIQADGLAIEGLQLLNLQGQVLATYPARRVLPVRALASGIYLLRIQTARGVAVKRWVKK